MSNEQVPPRLRRWQALTIALIVFGYAGYYLCRSNFSVALSLGCTLLRETFNLWTPTYFIEVAGMTKAEAPASVLNRL